MPLLVEGWSCEGCWRVAMMNNDAFFLQGCEVGYKKFLIEGVIRHTLAERRHGHHLRSVASIQCTCLENDSYTGQGGSVGLVSPHYYLMTPLTAGRTCLI